MTDGIGATYLRTALTQSFDEEELRTLCFDLGVDYDGLRGDGKDAKVRELVSYFSRRNEIDKLIQVIFKRQPDMFWRDATKETTTHGTLSNLATGRMLMVQVGRLETRMDQVESGVAALRTVTTATLTATIFSLVGLGILTLVLVIGG